MQVSLKPVICTITVYDHAHCGVVQVHVSNYVARLCYPRLETIAFVTASVQLQAV